MQKDIRTALIFCASFIGLIALLIVLNTNGNADTTTGDAPYVTMEDGVQIIDFTVKGGYSPRIVEAQAGIPTTLRMTTKGTFDCSSSLVIPSLGYQNILAPTGTELIAVPAEDAQGTLRGTCSMGMYDFEIAFK